MTQEHPITPPPELVKQWEGTAYNAAPIPYTHHIARCAARWGADQELEACVEWASCFNYDDYRYDEVLRDIRRSPKPPSLKEQALNALDEERAEMSIVNYKTIRAVLESLPS